MVVEGACLLDVLIGCLGRHGAGLVGVLNEVLAAVEHEFGSPAVQCESRAPPDLLEQFFPGRRCSDPILCLPWRSHSRARMLTTV